MSVERQRVYDFIKRESSSRDHAILVDGIWPRGVSKNALSDVEWWREVAPSAELRKWFGHKASRWEGFKRRYKEELRHKDHALEQLRRIARSKHLILLYAAKDTDHNQAKVIESLIREQNEGDR
jgi:uncharacterized protein YeaO (DUF488 family)